MSGSKPGPEPKWGPLGKATTVRLPKPLDKIAKDSAKGRDQSFNEFVVRLVAAEMGYDLTAPPPESQQEELPLIDDQEHAAA